MEHLFVSQRHSGKEYVKLRLLEDAVAREEPIWFDIYGFFIRYVPERTCHMEHRKSGPFYDVYYFDCCDKEWSEPRCVDYCSELPGTVCPYCGAKVVE